jgi:hypothetical protein
VKPSKMAVHGINGRLWFLKVRFATTKRALPRWALNANGSPTDVLVLHTAGTGSSLGFNMLAKQGVATSIDSQVPEDIKILDSWK